MFPHRRARPQQTLLRTARKDDRTEEEMTLIVGFLTIVFFCYLVSGINFPPSVYKPPRPEADPIHQAKEIFHHRICSKCKYYELRDTNEFAPLLAWYNQFCNYQKWKGVHRFGEYWEEAAKEKTLCVRDPFCYCPRAKDIIRKEVLATTTKLNIQGENK